MALNIALLVYSLLLPLLASAQVGGGGGSLTASTFDIRGLLVRADDATVRKADILQSCFSGFGLKHCKHLGSAEYPQPRL